MNTLSNIDIIKILDSYDIKINGVYSKDQLPKHLEEGWYIINLENHDQGNGTHWTCFKFQRALPSIYFDSFGIDCPEHLHLEIMPYIYNQREIQDLDSSCCGWFCIALIKYFHKNIFTNDAVLFRRFCNRFSKNTLLNDGILNQIL